jgi:outer membrane receptor protein involved in Fe transport
VIFLASPGYLGNGTREFQKTLRTLFSSWSAQPAHCELQIRAILECRFLASRPPSREIAPRLRPGALAPGSDGDVRNSTYIFFRQVWLLRGSWTTLDSQISYRFGQPEVVKPETPRAGYDKEGKKVVGDKAIAPVPQGSSLGIRNLLVNTTLTFGINNIFDTYPPLSVDNTAINYDPNVGNPTQRFFYVEIEKQF